LNARKNKNKLIAVIIDPSTISKAAIDGSNPAAAASLKVHAQFEICSNP
jgi:hypothetical protein